MNTRTFPALLALTLSVAAVGCGQPVGDGSSTETFEASARDSKSDSLKTHELDLTVDETRYYAPDGWGPETYRAFQQPVTVTDVGEDFISVEADEIIFRPPHDIDRQHGDGWLVSLSRNATTSFTFDVGTAFSIMVFHRPVESNDEWTLIEMPHPEGGTTPYFDMFGAGEGEESEQAAASKIPDGRCELVYGTSNGSDNRWFDSEQHLAELDEDGEVEFRIVVVPSFNFCDWELETYLPEVIITPLNTTIGNSA